MSLILLAQSDHRRNGGLWSVIWACIQIGVLIAVILTIGAGYGIGRFGSIGSAVSYMRGDRVVVENAFKVVEGARAGKRVVIEYVLSNVSGRPVKLVGVSVSCSCTVVGDIPTTLGKEEVRAFSANVDIAEANSDMIGSIQIFTDEPRTPVIALNYLIRVLPSL